jgi:NAD(P) transhydrogenase subunit alpha
MSTEIEVSLYVLVLAVPLGLELVRRVSPLLHTPLMSLTNAISAISVVGAIVVVGAKGSPVLSEVLGIIAVAFATSLLASRLHRRRAEHGARHQVAQLAGDGAARRLRR